MSAHGRYEVTSDRLVGRARGERFTAEPTAQLARQVAAAHLRQLPPERPRAAVPTPQSEEDTDHG